MRQITILEYFTWQHILPVAFIKIYVIRYIFGSCGLSHDMQNFLCRLTELQSVSSTDNQKSISNALYISVCTGNTVVSVTN
jgi:hypothetical protein